MEEIASKIMEELECETVFTIPLFGGIPVAESVVVTWIIMAFLILLSFFLTRGFKTRNISKRQAAVEFAVTKMQGLVESMIGEEGVQYVPYLMTVLKSPTKDLNVTIALAVMSIVLVQIAAIRAKGVKGWLHNFIEPLPIVAPFNILDLITRPLSLCMRLFGNVLGAFVIMKLLEMVVPIFLPPLFSLYFDVFDGILQAYVFVFLTSLYIKEAIE